MVFATGHKPWNVGKKATEPRSLEVRQRISETNKKNGVGRWMIGRTLSEETKAKLRLGMLGKPKTPEHARNIGIGHKGFKHTEETKILCGLSQKGPKSKNWKGRISIGENYKAWKEMMSRKRRNLKLNAEGLHTNAEWQEMKKQFYFTCPCCLRVEPEIKLSKDHIVPLSRGGSDWIENIQPLCLSCNKKKHLKTTKYERI